MTKKKVRKSTSRTAKRSKKKSKKVMSVQSQVRDLTLQAISERNLTLDQLSDLAGAMLDSASKATKDMLPTSRKSVLRQVLNGIDDAWAATATASVSSLRHARRYGLPLAKRDAVLLGKRLNSLEQELVKIVDRHARRLGGELGRELNYISGQMRKAGTQVRPAAKAAQKAIIGDMPMLTREVATVSVKAGQQMIHGLLTTTGAMLEGAGKALRGSSPRRSKSK